ncbi:hypothetical protein BW730_15930 [Tessaracoccus aquimaris]|uniref:Type VII secretion protein EccB n=1 Tax=Tessaracoccus aquimaris TaxID=1332264 RepID=A0A1Q2CRP0_9ACTN|nr:type VII secretion protein EccB [Tessaracoccus aquimaris]AQP48772.1 hypothetical protein BW730_15930 [Tessaracoccus aquimaris]
MATRKDLLKAQSFTSRRMIAAFVDRDPDDPTPPLRRVGTATFVSVLLGVVLLAGTTLLGLLGGGTANDSWKNEQDVILSDPQSGALFVYTEDKLYPMADVASARLLAAGADPKGQPRVIEVKTEALRGQVQQGTMGIPGSPRQLPSSKDLANYPIRLCSVPLNGHDQPYLTLEFGSSTPARDDIAVVARHSNGTDYLVYGGQTHQLYARPGQQSSLIGNLPVITPGDGWIASLPGGVPINPRPVEGYGSAGSENMSVGKMAYVDDGDRDRYYIQLTGGLSRISYLEMKAIQQEYGDTAEPTKLDDVQVTRRLNADIPTFTQDGIPLDQPTPPASFSSEKVQVCATFQKDAPGRIALDIGGETNDIPSNAPAPLGRYIDRVMLPALSGALLSNADADEAPGSATLLLDGKAYFIPTMKDRTALGYGDVTPMPVPGGLVNLLPPGLSEGSKLSRDMIVPIR